MKISPSILFIALAALASTANASSIATTYTRASLAFNGYDYHNGIGSSGSSFSSENFSETAQAQIDPNAGAPILQSYVSEHGTDGTQYYGASAQAELIYYVTIVGPDGLVPIIVNTAGHVNVDGSASIVENYATVSVVAPSSDDGDVSYSSINHCAGNTWMFACNDGASFAYSDTLQVLANQSIYVFMNTSAQLPESLTTSGSVTSWVDPTFMIDPAYASQYKIVYSLDLDQPSNDVPEPASIALFGLGFASIGLLRRRRSS